SPRNAVLFVVIVIVVTYYGSLAFESRGIFLIVLGSQLCMLVPAVVWTAANKFDFRDTFSLRLPSARGAMGGALLAISAWSVGATIFAIEARFFPGALQFVDEMNKLIGHVDLRLGIALSLLPALSEEACFRGIVLRGLSNTGSRWVAIIGSALLFGLFHLNP